MTDELDDRANARAVTHTAVRVAASWASTHLESDSAHRRLNMGWEPAIGAVVGRPAHGVSVGVRLADLHLVLLRDGELVRNRQVCGSAVSELIAWIQAEAASFGAPDRPLELPPYGQTLGLSDDAPLPEVSLDATTHLGGRFARAAQVLMDAARDELDASMPRCWPRDLDLTVSVRLKEGSTVERVDLQYEVGPSGEPRWGVWRWPATGEAPELPSGSWESDDRFGAVLSESELPEFGAERALREWLAAVIPLVSQRPG